MMFECRKSAVLVFALLSPMFVHAQSTEVDSTQVSPLEGQEKNDDVKDADETQTATPASEKADETETEPSDAKDADETATPTSEKAEATQSETPATPHPTSPQETAPLISTLEESNQTTGQEMNAVQPSVPDAAASLSNELSQDLTVAKTMGQPFGEGYFSLSTKAHRLQLSASLDQPLSVALSDSKIHGHAPIFQY